VRRRGGRSARATHKHPPPPPPGVKGTHRELLQQLPLLVALHEQPQQQQAHPDADQYHQHQQARPPVLRARVGGQHDADDADRRQQQGDAEGDEQNAGPLADDARRRLVVARARARGGRGVGVCQVMHLLMLYVA